MLVYPNSINELYKGYWADLPHVVVVVLFVATEVGSELHWITAGVPCWRSTCLVPDRILPISIIERNTSPLMASLRICSRLFGSISSCFSCSSSAWPLHELTITSPPQIDPQLSAFCACLWLHTTVLCLHNQMYKRVSSCRAPVFVCLEFLKLVHSSLLWLSLLTHVTWCNSVLNLSAVCISPTYPSLESPRHLVCIMGSYSPTRCGCLFGYPFYYGFQPDCSLCYEVSFRHVKAPLCFDGFAILFLLWLCFESSSRLLPHRSPYYPLLFFEVRCPVEPLESAVVLTRQP